MVQDLTSSLLLISALGIYIHSFFLSISLGFPVVIIALLYKYWRTEDHDYAEAVRIATSVLGLNFALGAITGTLVEFGLVQAWPGTIFAIATFGLMPLTMELIAFIGEIVLLILFIVTLGRVKTPASIGIMTVYAGMAVMSGALITLVNSWINVPWGTGSLANALNPFMPPYGPNAVDARSLIRLKLQLLSQLMAGRSAEALQNPTIAHNVGVTLTDPFVAFYSPYAWASVVHAVTAAMIVGISVALAGYAYRYFRSGSYSSKKVIRAILPILLFLLILQPTFFGDSMGKMVAAYQPTKFALMESAETTEHNPLMGLLAFGDPQRPILGFDQFRKACNSLHGQTLGDLTRKADPSANPGNLSSASIEQICLSNLQAIDDKMGLISFAYSMKISMGIIALLSLCIVLVSVFRIRVLSRIVERLFGSLGQGRLVLIFSIVELAACAITASLGWFIREVGRLPWTVYGLLYPQELVSPVPIDPIVLAVFTIIFSVTAVVGVFGMYLVCTRRLRFIELLERGAGVE
jgi:cytochrome d ubiquinol oxidase subunit I